MVTDWIILSMFNCYILVLLPVILLQIYVKLGQIGFNQTSILPRKIPFRTKTLHLVLTGLHPGGGNLAYKREILPRT